MRLDDTVRVLPLPLHALQSGAVVRPAAAGALAAGACDRAAGGSAAARRMRRVPRVAPGVAVQGVGDGGRRRRSRDARRAAGARGGGGGGAAAGGGALLEGAGAARMLPSLRVAAG